MNQDQEERIMIKINKVESTGYDNGVDKNTKGTWKR